MRPFALLIFLWVAACGAPDPAPFSVVDGLNRSVPVLPPVQRVVTIAPNATELVFAAGGGSRVVGTSDADDYPPEVAERTQFQALPLDHEAVAALRPDLVVATAGVNALRDAEGLADIDIPTYFLRLQSLDDVLAGLSELGRIFGTEARAHVVIDSLTRIRTRLAADTIDVYRPSVVFLIGDDTLFSFGRGAYIHSVIALAGGRSVTESLPLEGPILSEEFVMDADPEIIVGAWGAGNHTARLLALHPDWDSVRAIRDEKVFGVDPDLVLRAGPRLFEGALAIGEFMTER